MVDDAAFVVDHCEELTKLLLESVDVHVPRQSQRVRQHVVDCCLQASPEFVKEFIVQILKASKGYSCLGKCKLLLQWCMSILKVSGGDESLHKALVKIVDAQDKILEHLVKINRVPSSRSHNCVRPAIVRQPGLVDLYVSSCESSTSGSAGLVYMLWGALSTIKRSEKSLSGIDFDGLKSKLLQVFVDKILSGRKSVPSESELACYRDLLADVSENEIERLFVPAATKMAKRSPEISMVIINAAISNMTSDLSSCSDDFLPLILQQAKHGKETVRKLSVEMMELVARKTKDVSVLMSYAEAARDALMAKDATRLKSPQEKTTVASVLGMVTASDLDIHANKERAVSIIESICQMIEAEVMAETKQALIQSLGKWISIVHEAPPSFGKVAHNCLRSAESVRRSFLEMLSDISSYQSVGKELLDSLDDIYNIILEGTSKAAMRWDATLALSFLLDARQWNSSFDMTMETKGIWNILKDDTCPYLGLDVLRALSPEDAKQAVTLAVRMLNTHEQISDVCMRSSCLTLVSYSLHYDTSVRRYALESIKNFVLVESGDFTRLLVLLDSLRQMCSEDTSIAFVYANPTEFPLSNVTVHERYLGALLAMIPLDVERLVPASFAIKVCILSHHPMVSGSRGAESAWSTILSAFASFAKSIAANIDEAIETIVGPWWGIEASDEVIRASSTLALRSISRMCGEQMFVPFIKMATSNLNTSDHDMLTSKQLRIYATPFGRLSNESADGGMIPAELMEDLLADKSSIKPPVFHPSLENSVYFRDQCLKDIENSKGKKEDPAAAARKKQLASEAEVRVQLVELRDRLSRWLLALGQFAAGCSAMTCANMLMISKPSMDFLASPLLGESSALESLNLIVSCIPGPIGHFHTTLCSSLYIIKIEEAKTNADYNNVSFNGHVLRGADVLIRATGGVPPSDKGVPVKVTRPLTPQMYSFFFPIVNAILRAGRPTALHQALLEFIDLHSEVSACQKDPKEFDLLFHVLEVVPALRSSVQNLLTRLCAQPGESDVIFAAAIRGVLLAQSSSRMAALLAISNAQEDFFNCSLEPDTLSLIWIASNDVDAENASIGKSIWEKCGATPSMSMVSQVVKYCACNASEVRLSSCKALGSLALHLQNTEPNVVHDILFLVTGAMYSANSSLSQRCGAAVCLAELAPILDEDGTFKALEFLLSSGFLDRDPTVRSLMLAAGVAIVDGGGSANSEKILPTMEKYLDNPIEKGLKEEEYDNVRLGAVVCLGAAAQHMDPGNPKVVSIIQTLLEVLRTPSEMVQRSISDRLPPLMKSLSSTNKSFVEDTVSSLVETCLNSESYGDRRGAAYGLSGCVKGLGLSSLKSFGIMEALKRGVENKKEQKAREGALIAFECLSSKMGRLFEPYVIQILPILLSSLGDGKAEVREAADAASRVIMSQLTAQGVKLVLPSLLGGAEEKQWRAKQGSIQLLGSMAYCAPKQLSSCLPQIVPVLGEALADPHPKVSAAAKDAMDEVGAVIKNPEVAKLVPTLMSALADPNKNNKKALDTLLGTIFVNTVDSASLALIIPVVHRGLKDRSGDIKKRAARIVGNLCTLMNDPKDMSPYLPTLMPELQDALIDPLPEVRGAAAKALGSLTSGMAGMQASSAIDITPWLIGMMKSENSAVERSGAAQGLAEVLAVKGPAVLNEILPEIFTGCQSKSAATREGSITLFKYLPHCMPEEFQAHLPEVLPCVLGGLADESEGVREASFAAGSVAVDLYAKTSLPLVLPAVESGASDKNWRIRQSSIELLGDLLFKVAGTSGRIQQDLNDEESEGISVESHGQVIIDVLGLNRRNDVLARLYLARADVAYTVRSAALHVWKTIVTNTPKTLVEILPVLMSRVISGLSSDGEDQRNSAGQCLGELVKKLGDRVLPKIVPILIEGAYSEDAVTRVGVLNGMREVASNASRLQLAEFMADILSEIQRLLCDEDDNVRQAAGGALEVIFQTGGGSAAESVIPSLLSGLDGNEEKVAKSLEGLRVVLGVRPQLLGVMVPKLVEPPLSRTDLMAIGALSEVAGESIHTYLSKILPPLFRIFSDDESLSDVATKALLGVATAVEDDGLHLFISQINRGFDTTETVFGSCIALTLFCKNTDIDFQDHINGLLATLVPLLADNTSEKNLKCAWEALSSVTAKIPKEMAPSFVRSMKDSVNAAKERMLRLAGKPQSSECVLPGLVLPKALSPFIPIYLQGILQGSSAELRELAAEGIGELVELTNEATLKPFVIQITGPLIRIVGDRFPSHTKSAILHTMGILVDKAGLALRPFIPQLQTTFVKCLPDSSREVRLEGAKNLGKLSRMAPRLDQLVCDISSSCISAEIDGPKEAYLAAIASILKESGGKLKDETKERVSEAVIEGATAAIQSENEGAVKNAAEALGEYSKHCSSSEFNLIMRHDGFGPLGTLGTALGSRLCTAVYSSLVAPLASTKILEENMLPYFIQTISTLSKDVSVDVRMSAAVAGGRVVCSELAASSQSESLEKIMNIFMAHLGPDQHVEVQKQTLAILRRIASESPTALIPFFVSMVPTVIGTTKEATGATKLAAERTLAKILQIESGEEVTSKYLAQPGIGPVAKASLTESYLRRLLRISDYEGDDLSEYAI